MKLLDRYLVRVYLTSTAAALAVMLVAGLLLEFLEKARLLLGEKSTLSAVLWLLLLKVPQLGGMLLPAALVVGVGLTNARLGRDRELQALAAAGLGAGRLLLPAALGGGLVALLALANAEFLSPPAAAADGRLQREVFGWMEPAWQFYRERHWFRGEPGRLFQVVGPSPDGTEIKNLHLYQLDDDFRLRARTHLMDARWTGRGWQARQAEEWVFDDGRLVKNSKGRDARFDWPEGPERFLPLNGTPRALRLGELMRRANEMERRGTSSAAYLLEANLRAAYPLSGLVLALLAFPGQVSARRRRSAAGALLEAVAWLLAAYVLFASCTTAVGNGLLRPWQGAWLPPGLLALGATAAWSLKWKG